MEIEFKNRDYNDYYDKLLGGDKFSIAVNKKIADYWGRTGAELNPQFAMIEVLAEFYNEKSTPSNH